MTIPQLQLNSCVHLLLMVTCTLPEELVERLQNQTSPDRVTSRSIEWKWEAVSAGEQFVYIRTLMNRRGPRVRRQYKIGLHYDVTKMLHKKTDVKASPRIDKIISILAELNQGVTVACDAQFLYDENTAKKLFPIKSDLPQSSEGLFDEIRGLTMVKTENGREIYRVKMESEDLDQVTVDVSFHIQLSFDKKLSDHVLEQASLISAKFIVQEPA